jgi:hypothetical protein
MSCWRFQSMDDDRGAKDAPWDFERATGEIDAEFG